MERTAKLLEVRSREVEETAKQLAKLARQAAEELKQGSAKTKLAELLEALHDHLHSLSHLVEECSEALKGSED
ncbi:MAG: hypothetical protein DRJ97_08280 [Thermoprotei archaeon]|nr:MAG: hypothetical protein DRJ97_08280 [Thermoprotei archaeon]